jgi:hypothetical protein
LKQSIESHDRQIGELTDLVVRLGERIDAQSANIDKLIDVSNRDAADIMALARIAESRERRITGLENG